MNPLSPMAATNPTRGDGILTGLYVLNALALGGGIWLWHAGAYSALLYAVGVRVILAACILLYTFWVPTTTLQNWAAGAIVVSAVGFAAAVALWGPRKKRPPTAIRKVVEMPKPTEEEEEEEEFFETPEGPPEVWGKAVRVGYSVHGEKRRRRRRRHLRPRP